MNNNLVDAVKFTCEGVIAILSLFSLGVLIKENNRLKKEMKNRFYRCFIVLAVACIAGWGSLMMNEHSQNYVLLHAFVKSLDYVLFPYVCVTVADMVNYTKHRKKVMIVIIANAIFEFVSIFTKWSFYIDSDYIYAAGQYHFVYHITIYIAIFYLALAFINYGKSFKKENIFSLISIIMVLLVGVVLQEAFSIRVMFIAVAPAIILLFIHINEFSQLKFDEELAFKNELLSKDALTGLGSRFSYNKEVSNYEKNGIDDDFIVIAIDINGLKMVNDNYGHIKGDAIICATGNAITNVFSEYGKCFRIGGDEFIVFANIDKMIIKSVFEKFYNEITSWEDGSIKLSVSTGYCFGSEINNNIYDALKKADERMFMDKNNYYIKNNIDRRKKISVDNNQ